MKISQLELLASLTFPLFALASTQRYDLGDRRGAVAALDNSDTIDLDNQEILLQDEDSAMEHVFRCPRNSGKKFSFAHNQKYVACCAPGQHLVGSPKTAFDCCGEGHVLAGSKDVGFACCPKGQTWDGTECKKSDPVCTNGKTLVDGKCVCPAGTTEGSDGSCGEASEPSECDSGLEEGKCYTLRMENGHLLGYHKAGWYTASVGSRNHMFGKFKFCKSESCDGGSPIDPSDGFHILDLHGDAESGARRNHWLDNKVNGGHISKTPDFSKAGSFSITKWACGEYCLSGAEHGLSPTCPSADPAITFSTGDTQACRPVQVTEVPCDIRDDANNCSWGKKAGTCGVGDKSSCVCH